MSAITQLQSLVLEIPEVFKLCFILLIWCLILLCFEKGLPWLFSRIGLGGRINRFLEKQFPKPVPPTVVEFPVDVMDEIIQYLSLRDRIRMRNVCRSWRKLLNDFVLHPPELPWSLCLKSVKEHHRKTIDLYSMSDGTLKRLQVIDFIRFELPYPINRCGWDCCFSSNGWLLMAIDPNTSFHELWLFDPLSRKMLSLPSLAKIPFFDEYLNNYAGLNVKWRNKASLVRRMIEQIEVSVSPAQDTHGLLVAASFSTILRKRIAICRADDKEWTILPEDGYIDRGVLLFYKGCLIINRFIYDGHMEMQRGVTAEKIISLTGNTNLKLILNNIISPASANEERVQVKYLVDSVDGELLMVVQHILSCQDEVGRVLVYKTIMFDIYKYKNMEKLSSLGDQVLFLTGRSRSLCIPSKISGCFPRNSIVYFQSSDDLGVFDVERKRIKFGNIESMPQEQLQTLWFTPKCRANVSS